MAAQIAASLLLAALFFGALFFARLAVLVILGNGAAFERNRQHLRRDRHRLGRRGLAIDLRTNRWVETRSLSRRQIEDALAGRRP